MHIYSSKINSVPVRAEHGTNSNTQKAVLNCAEAAFYLRIGERKLRQLIAERDIRTCRIGRSVVIRRVDLDNYLESQLV